MTQAYRSGLRAATLGMGTLAVVLAAYLVLPGFRATTASATIDASSAGSIDRMAIAAQRRDAARIVYPADRPPVLALPDGSRQTIHSVLNVGRVLSYGDYVWNDAGVAPGPVFIRVDLGRQLLSVFRGGNEIGTALVLFGTDDKPTPSGLLTIVEKDENHYSRSYDAKMRYMLRLTADGIAIHAADVRGAAATHGCIGVPTGFARLLFAAARTGDRVGIVAPAGPV